MNSDFSDLLVALNDAGAEYLVVGGYAVGKHTEPRYTKDLDVWINNSRENAELVLQALAAYGAPVKGATADDFTGTDKFFQIGVEPVRIDVISDLPGVDFSECWENRVVADVDGLSVNFISLPDLIRNKEFVGRPRDLRHVKELRKKMEMYGESEPKKE
ncbi:MAG: hypothetical protein IPM50_08780 [Acidobacteriota bacterium]|nr:MAG: hypothetical protein IPM50_08780 [Acidobacteriota bacterium]